MDNGKISRVLTIYNKLLEGNLINKAEEALNYGVNERTIQRDIDDIRMFMDSEVENTGIINSVIYDRRRKGYRLEQIYKLKLTNGEILAICKILLDSRAFVKEDMEGVLSKLITACVPKENQRLVKELIRNEEFHYVELQHKTRFLDTMWTIGQAIRNCQYIEIKYKGLKATEVKTRKIKPLAILFSEYYFYLVAFIDDKEALEKFDVLNDSYPTIYRIDRIREMRTLEEHYHIPYASRFEEGEFRKRIQFMFGGKLRKIKFKCVPYAREAILDRLPTAQIIKEEEDGYVMEAEVFGDGVDMWLRGQGENVKVMDKKHEYAIK